MKTRIRLRALVAGLAMALGLAASAMAQTAIAQTAPNQGLALPLRGPTAVGDIAPAQRMTPLHNSATREVRNYPEQPPVIPHNIEGYDIDLNGNKCLSCHARSRTGESQAPMISITHFMDRDGQFLATVSPRRFFCTGCHVPQHEVKAPVTNEFVDIDSLLARRPQGAPKP